MTAILAMPLLILFGIYENVFVAINFLFSINSRDIERERERERDQQYKSNDGLRDEKGRAIAFSVRIEF